MGALDLLATSLRTFRRRPAVAAAAVLTLACGIGLLNSVFALTYTVLWQGLPVPDANRVLWITPLDRGQEYGTSPGALYAWSDRSRTLSAIAGIREAHATLDDASGVERVSGAYVSAGYFDVLGLRASRGATFDAALDRPGAEPVVVISDRLWRTRYGSAASIVGTRVRFDNQPRTIVGVMPAQADALGFAVDWWAPLALPASQRSNLGANYLDVIGRLAPSADAGAARVELQQIADALHITGDSGAPLTIAVERLAARLRAAYDAPMWLLFAAALVSFVIACVNVASLLIADGLDRRGEVAVRAALGATRWHLARQFAAEATLVALAACALGLVVAQWMLDALVAMMPPDLPRLAAVRIGGPALAFAALTALAAAVISGTWPALRGSLAGDGAALRTRGATASAADVRLRRIFVVAQLGLAVALAAAAALLLQSVRALEHAPRGYDAHGVLTAAIAVPASALREPGAAARGFDEILQAVGAVPGVSRAGMSTRVPLAGSGGGSDVARMDESFEDGSDRQVRVRFASAGYFAVTGVRVLHGREFGSDGAGSPRVAIVNETLARRLAGNAPLVGMSIKFAVPVFNQAGTVTPWTVVGVVADTFDQGPRRIVAPEITLPLGQGPPEMFDWIGRQALLAIRSDGDAAALTPAIRRAVSRTSWRPPLFDVRTLDDRFRDYVSRDRMLSILLLMFAAAGVALAGLGTFAVISHTVRRQRGEIAVRLALGAAPGRLVRRVIGEGLVLAAAGLVVGLVLFVPAAGLLRSFLFGIGPAHPPTLLAIAGLVVAVTVAATLIPARRAASVDPAAVLRAEG